MQSVLAPLRPSAQCPRHAHNTASHATCQWGVHGEWVPMGGAGHHWSAMARAGQGWSGRAGTCPLRPDLASADHTLPCQAVRYCAEHPQQRSNWFRACWRRQQEQHSHPHQQELLQMFVVSGVLAWLAWFRERRHKCGQRSKAVLVKEVFNAKKC